MAEPKTTEGGTTFTVTEFTENRPDADSLGGVTLTTTEAIVMLRRSAPGGAHLVPVQDGWSLTGLFSPIRLVELHLTLRLSAEGYRELYAAFGHGAVVTKATSHKQAALYEGKLALPDARVVELAKQAHPAASQAQQLLDAVRKHNDLIEELDAWELRQVYPVE